MNFGQFVAMNKTPFRAVFVVSCCTLHFNGA